MYGAILGDLAGSQVEFNQNTDPAFEIWTEGDFLTDDSILTVALADALLNRLPFGDTLRSYYRRYPDYGYGKHFRQWAITGRLAIESCGNGAPMRISPVAYAAGSEAEVVRLAKEATVPSHPHPDGVRGATAVALAIYWARNGMSKKDVFAKLDKEWPNIESVTSLRSNPRWEGLAIPTVYQALSCVREADSFETAIRNAISIGGDADTIGAIAGSIAEPLYGIPQEDIAFARSKLDRPLLSVLDMFLNEYSPQPKKNRMSPSHAASPR